MDAIHALKTRRTIRKYTNDPVSKDTLTEIVDCGRLAATAMNIQPWEFVVINEKEKLKSIAALMNHSQFLGEAPAAILVLCKDLEYFLEDGCAASANLLIAAHSLGLGACWIAGEKQAFAKPILEFIKAPEEYRLVSMISIGVPDESPEPQPKREINQVIHWQNF